MPVSALKKRLLLVAIEEFGRHGLDGTSTRAIAAAARTPMSSITYHFGGKWQLYLAAADHVSAAIQERVTPTMMQVETIKSCELTVKTARQGLGLLLRVLTEMVAGVAHDPPGRFMAREFMNPTEAFARIANGPMRDLLILIASLLRTVAGSRISQEEAHVHAVILIAQLPAFRLATLCATGRCDALDGSNVDLVHSAAAEHLDAILNHLEAAGDAPACRAHGVDVLTAP